MFTPAVNLKGSAQTHGPMSGADRSCGTDTEAADRDKARPSDVRTIKDRVERKNIVALLQVNSTALARALD